MDLPKLVTRNFKFNNNDSDLRVMQWNILAEGLYKKKTFVNKLYSFYVR